MIKLGKFQLSFSISFSANTNTSESGFSLMLAVNGQNNFLLN